MTRNQKGFTLVEILIAMTIVSILVAVGLPRLIQASAKTRLRLAAQEVAGALHTCRMAAVKQSANVAAKFRTTSDGQVTFRLYRDGDGDGVRTADINTGIDPAVSAPRKLKTLGRGIRFGFPPGPAPRHPGSPSIRLKRLEDPIRFNRSDLASFTPNGGATPGSVYLTDSHAHLAAVRVYHYTGKIKVLFYDAEGETWQQ